MMELMSPAGNYAALRKAVEGGADAVYLGLPFLNARKPAKNFGVSEITEAIEFAHNKNVKVYVTLNIDLKSSELKLLTKVLILLSEISVDAIIVKDLAILYLIHNFFNNSKDKTIPIHISTQFGVSNSQTLFYLKKNFPLIERVVLAREINYEELKIIGSIDNNMIPEIEVFVQGSMCFSFSGKCLLSSFVGGKSANRGVCQAPCRVKYDISNSEKKNSNSTTLFSMKDLSLVSYIKELDECNVTALKIEGRLKNPSWVKEITSIYRDTIDYFYSDVDKSIKIENDFQKREEKLKLYSGRELNSGFLFELDSLTSEHNVHFGKKLGTVISSNIIDNTIELSFSDKRDNSSLRFVHDNQYLGILHNVSFEKSNIIKTSSDKNKELLRKLEKGTLVYEVIVSSVVDKGNKDSDIKKDNKIVGMNRYNLSIELLDSNNELKIIIETDEREIILFEKYKKVVKVKRGIDPDALFDLLANKHFNGWRIKEFDLASEFLLAKSQLNNIISIVSREIAIVNKDLNLKGIKILDKRLIEELSPISQTENVNDIEKNRYNDLSISNENSNSLKLSADDLDQFLIEWDNLEGFSRNRKKILSSIIIDQVTLNHLDKLEELLLKVINIDSVVISLFSIVFENELLSFINLIKRIEDIISITKSKVVYEINDFGHLEVLNSFNVPKDRVVCGAGISVYNYFAVKTLKELGLSSFHIPLEIDKQGLSDILNFVNKNSNYKMKVRMNIYSRIPLFYSRAESKNYNMNSVYKDSIGTEMISNTFNNVTIFESKDFYNISDVKFDDYLLVNELIVDLSNEENIISKFIHIKNNSFKFSDNLSFNFDRKLF